MKKYLFAFDLDGTLLNNNEEITNEVIDGIRKINELGHETCIITGRSWNMMKEIYEATGVKTPAGVFNGGALKAAKDEAFKTVVNHLKKEDVDSMLNNELITSHAKNITVETKHDAYLTDLNSASAELYKKWSSVESKQLTDERDYIDAISILIELASRDEVFVESLCKELRVSYPKMEINSWFSHFTDSYTIEITDKFSRKDFALKKLAKHLGVELKDTFAFGDGLNDKEMLMTAGRGVAMLNASDVVKTYADDVTTKSNDNNGVMDYIFTKVLV